MNTLLVLSSSSPARKQLLERLNIPFIINSPDIDETPLAGESVTELVTRLSLAKAQKSALLYPDALIIGCDQVGFLDGQILGKPHTEEKAFQQLARKRGRCVTFYTGICLLDAQKQIPQVAIETYDVFLRQYSDETIRAYLKKEQPLQCAGSIDVEGMGICLIEKLQGHDYTALIGLPLIRLTSMLANAGYPLI